MIVRFRKLRPDAVAPRYATKGAAGCDLFACLLETLYVRPGSWAKIETGLSVELPPGYEAQVRPRSGLALKHGVTVLNAPGTVDEDFRGEICVVLVNHDPFEDFTVRPGDRIAQLVLAKCERAEFFESADLTESERGAGGFGSSGR